MKGGLIITGDGGMVDDMGAESLVSRRGRLSQFPLVRAEPGLCLCHSSWRDKGSQHSGLCVGYK